MARCVVKPLPEQRKSVQRKRVPQVIELRKMALRFYLCVADLPAHEHILFDPQFTVLNTSSSFIERRNNLEQAQTVSLWVTGFMFSSTVFFSVVTMIAKWSVLPAYLMDGLCALSERFSRSRSIQSIPYSSLPFTA